MEQAKALADHYLNARSERRTAQDEVAQAEFASKKWVWVADKDEGYVAGYLVAENGDEVQVHLNNGKDVTVNINDTEKMNPPKFDRVEDMADLTYLNEASVIHNLRLRYLSNLIYTYSGLFLVAVNPYKRLPIYTDQIVASYKNKKRSERPPHIYAISDAAYHDMLQDRENQSILITGESGAGKTENTKKVIQHLASIAMSGSLEQSSSNDGTGAKEYGTLEQQILQANPILESFGNAQTIRNNNSSRFGKFIRIEFNAGGQIVGANIERYLLEKSRVTHQTNKERSYHIFYQLLRGAPAEIKKQLLLDGQLEDYTFISTSNKSIDGVDDASEFKALCDSFEIMKFSKEEQMDLFRAIAAVLHLGNIKVTEDREDQAQLPDSSVAEKVCHVLGIPIADFAKGLLKPRIKAGRDWVVQARNVDQVLYSLEALARATYERMFGSLVDRINKAIDRPSAAKSSFIGVLDIAGFEIFEKNSFEQFCINYNNEKLQQFFNTHMFILEQEEYKREGIEWQFIDFGLDLQPTIDLIEKSSPIGVLSCLDEECVMPKATDKTFTEKLHGLWKGKSPKYDVPRFGQGFILQHYAGKVEYSTETWLDKNKDPLNENITRLLANSSDKYIASLFSDYLGDEGEANSGGGLLKNRTSVLKKGAFRTVAQRHKEQLASLMAQLHTTQPHFVRCIIPNEEKKAGKIDANLVLDQLRCNGVLEGIRICRAGFPNRLLFAEFRQRYEILAPGVIPKGYMDGRKASVQLIEALSLDKNQYRIGTSKVFFRAGVLASLEETRDARLSAIISGFQAACRGYLSRRMYRRRLDQLKAIRVIQKNARVYVQLREWSWWRLYSKVKPLLNVTRVDEELKKKEDSIRELAERAQREEAERQRLESVKAQLDAEKLAIEDTLRAERSAAADQQEILIRTQKRELELNEELRAVTQELETLEEKYEEQAKQRRRIENELQAAKGELEREKSLLERVELEKAAREQQAKKLEIDIATEAERVRLLEIERKSSEARIAELERSLQSGGEKEGELSRVKLQLQQRIADLEERLEREEADKLVSQRSRGTLEVELKSANQELSDLNSSKNEIEASLKRREAELNALQQQLRTETGDKETAERARRELVTKLQAVEAELDTERNERDKLAKQQRKLQGELEQLHTVLEDKGSEQTKQAEFNRLRQTELADLRAQLLAVQADLEDTRRKNAQQLEALKTQIEDARQENSALTRAKQSYEKQAKEAAERLEEAEQVQQRLEKSRRTLESDLQAVRLQSQELETNLLEMKNAREAADRQVGQVASKASEMEEAVQRLERERSALQKQMSDLRDEMQDGERKRSALEQARKKAVSDVSDLQSRLEEEEATRAELNRKLTTKQAEYDALRERYQKDAQEKGTEMEEKARRLEKELVELQTKYALLEANIDKLEKARSRLTAESEDLKHEMEREHAITRAAEKAAKQIEFQLNAANAQIESERHLRDIAESNCRKLQSTIDSLMLDMEEKGQQMLSISRGKADLEQELKALIDEIGDGGKNVHELEKAKRRLEARVEELEAQLEEEESSRHSSEESMRRLTEQLSDIRLKAEHDMAAKEAQMEETRRMLLKEVNSLGEQLDEELLAKNEILKAKKKLESDLEDISNTADSSARSRAEIEKAKKKAENSLRELQLKLEGEERSRKQLEELANRHEKKSAALASEVERLESALEEETRARKQMEKQVSELTAELNGGDGMESKATLLEAKKRLEKEVSALREQLEEADEARAVLEAQKSAGSSELESFRSRMAGDLEAKIEKLEDSRRALLAAQRLNQQELEDRSKDISILEKQRRLLQAEVDDLKQRLEAEILAKGEEAAGRRKAITELREFQIKFEAEQAKLAEQTETSAAFRQKADDATTRLEAAELAKLKVEKSEGTLRIQLKEMEDSLAEANKDRKLSEERVKSLEDQIADLQDKMDEDSAEVVDLGLIRRRLQEEVEELRERSKRDLDDREAAIDATRKKYQKELKQLAAELETEKNQVLKLRETSKKFETEAEDLNARLELEVRSGLAWKKDKERLEARVIDLTRIHSDAVAAHDELQSQTVTLLAQVRDLRSNLDDADAQRLALEKSKRNLETRIEELNDTAHEASKSRQAALRSLDAKDQECVEIRSQMEEALDAAEAHQEKLRKVEMAANDSVAELQKERDANSELERTKLALEKQNKELSLRIVDLEAGAMADSSKSSKRLETRLEDLAMQLDSEARDKNDALRNARKTERTIRELQYSLAERDKARSRYEDEMSKMQERMAKMKQQIEELEMSENNLQLVKRRAEREALENKERAIRFEKEVEKLKSRLDRAVYTS